MCEQQDSGFYTVRGYQLLEKESGKRLSPSLEDYLEMIYRAVSGGERVRVSRLAKALNVKPSSASRMVALLSEKGFVDYEKYGQIGLTAEGKRHGAYLLWRHEVINKFFSLIYPPGNKNAGFFEGELVEHNLRPQTVIKIARLCRFFEQNPAIYEAYKLTDRE